MFTNEEMKECFTYNSSNRERLPCVINNSLFKYDVPEGVQTTLSDRQLTLVQFEYLMSLISDIPFISEMLMNNSPQSKLVSNIVTGHRDVIPPEFYETIGIAFEKVCSNNKIDRPSKNHKQVHLVNLLNEYCNTRSYNINFMLSQMFIHKLNMFEFDIIDSQIINRENSPYTKADACMALIKDDKGNAIKMKLGKAVGKMFPTLCKKFINYYVEAIKEADENSVEYFVHEGSKRIHFRYAYTKAVRRDKNPTISSSTLRGAGRTASLIASCMRGTVISPEIGITTIEGDSASVNMPYELREKGIHPAELYGSGDFSIVYITDKPDPLDKKGKVFSRTLITHFKVDTEKMKEDSKRWKIDRIDDEIVNIGPIYTASNVVTELAKNYLNDKYGYLDKDLTDTSLCVYGNLLHNYKSADYSPNATTFAKLCKKVVTRFPRILCLDTNGKRLKLKDFHNIRKSTISLYIDRNSSISEPFSVIGTADGNFELTESTENKSTYIYFCSKYESERFNLSAKLNLLSDYRSYGKFPQLDYVEKCTLTNNKVLRKELRDVIFFEKDGSIKTHRSTQYVASTIYNETYVINNKVYVDSNNGREHVEARYLREIVINPETENSYLETCSIYTTKRIRDYIFKDKVIYKTKDKGDIYVKQNTYDLLMKFKERS